MDRINNTVQRVAGRRGTNAGPSRVRERGGRGSNWAAIESDVLIDVAQEVQLKNKRTSLNFTKTDATEIHVLFCQKIHGCNRTAPQLITRIGTMKKEFSTLRWLSLKSGWSWDYEQGVVVAPNPEIFKVAIQKLSKRWHYLEKKIYPWFRQMDELIGGAQSRGDQRDMEFSIAQSQLSGTRSQTDSSDNPPDDEDVEIDESVNQQRESRPTAGQGSDSSFPMSRSSDSLKRKSADSDQPLTQGKKIQRTISEKRKEIMEMNATNKEMLQTVKELVKGKLSKTDEMDKCIEKMNQWNLPGRMRFWCIRELGKQWFRRYFLSASVEQITEDYQFSSQPQPYTQPPQPFPTQPPSNSQAQQPAFDQTLYENFNIFGINLRPPNH